MKNYYNLLGIETGAGAEVIRLAYRNLAKQYHPDRNPGRKDIEEKFKEISEAYNVLSDPEKKRKYDLKLAYHHQGGQRNEGSGSSERKYRKRPAGPPFKKPKSAAEIRKENLTSYMFVGVLFFFFAMMIVLLVTGPLESEDEKAMKQLVLNSMKYGPDFKDGPAIYNADSPYDDVFGDSWILEDNNNCVIVVNTNKAEVVVCLVEKNAPFRTIRNEYLEPGMKYRISGIPNGTYYIKAYFGREWNPKKVALNGKVKGGFVAENGFYKSDKEANLIRISSKNSGENLSYSTYEVYLTNLLDNEARRITVEEFFK